VEARARRHPQARQSASPATPSGSNLGRGAQQASPATLGSVGRRPYHAAVPPTPVDPWTAFLQWLQTIIVPDWSGLIRLVPILLVVGLVGPILTLLVLYWLYARLPTQHGHVRTAELEPRPAPSDADGQPTYPPNQPYCPTHRLIYPAPARMCGIDGEELRVRCPVDDSVRVASQQLCRTCGTRYELGAALAPVAVRRRGRPPAGGAAVA
jgi:hypothetical protein